MITQSAERTDLTPAVDRRIRPNYVATILLNLHHISLREIAKRCGISYGTVYKFLHRRGRVAEPYARVVREEVETALREAGWSGPADSLWRQFEG